VANFYRDNADLRLQMTHGSWERIVPFLEDEFRLAAEGGPSDLAEAREMHDAVLDLVGEIAADVVAPTAADVDRDGTSLKDGRVHWAPATEKHWAALKDAGLLGFCIERSLGGQNLPATLYTASVELISRACASLMNLYALQGCGETIQTFGCEELRHRFVPAIAAGEMSCCMSLSEPNAGSALGTVTTRAVPVDEATGLWKLTGTKVFSTNGGGDLLLVLARSEDGTTDARGLSLFAVPRSDRVVIGKLEEKLGLHGSPTALVHLEGAEGWLIGERRRGLVTYVMSLIHGARLEVAAQAVGIAQAAVTAAIRYVGERHQFGHAIEHFAPVRQLILEMESRVQAGRNLIYAAAEVVDQIHGVTRMLTRHPDDPRAAAWIAEQRRLVAVEDILTPLAKYAAAEWGNEACYRALQVHGGYGYCREYGIERHVRDVRVTNLYEGTSEIQVGGIVSLLAGGGFEAVWAEVSRDLPADSRDSEARARLDAGVKATREACRFLAEQSADKGLVQLRSRPLADMVADVVAGARFLVHAPHDPRKRVMARAYLHEAAARWAHRLAVIVGGDRTALDAYGAIVASYR
jgi:alkylation response protein AidB-like acyl-CoA dehydrogenase